MASVAVYAPIVGAAALGYLLATAEEEGPAARNPTEEERMQIQQLQDLARNGASASVWHANHNRILLMGDALNEELTLDVRGGGYNPDSSVNPLEAMYRDHAKLTSFDRQDTMLALRTGDGQIRMTRRSPIVATLTPEIYNPSNPAATTTFAMNRYMPNWANEAQVSEARRLAAGQVTPQFMLRQNHTAVFHNRAAGQGFRYE